jgi:hypothetical protein
MRQRFIDWVHYCNKPDRRDGYLFLKGALFVFLGYAYAVAHVPSTTRNSLSTVTQYVPLWVFGVLWMAAGTYCITAGFSRRKLDGFAVGVLMPSIWGLLYLICWIHGDPGRGWVSAGIFWAIAGAMYCASGLIDPMPVVRKDPSE